MNLYLASYVLCIGIKKMFRKLLKILNQQDPNFFLFVLLELWFVYHFPRFLQFFLPPRQNAMIFPFAMISDLLQTSVRAAGESSILLPAAQWHRFSGKRQSRNESYFGIFYLQFFWMIQSESLILPTWAQSKDVPVPTFPEVKLVKSTKG